MFTAGEYDNASIDGHPVLEVLQAEGPECRRFVPLKSSKLTGRVVGPLADMQLTQTFRYSKEECRQTLEAAYRFPLPGDAAVTGVTVRFGEVTIQAKLKERQRAEAEYEDAKAHGRQAALAARESPDVFTLQIAGLQPDSDIVVQTLYVQLARSVGGDWSIRVPLTTAPRYVREDERGTRHAHGQPLALLRDPGHRFGLVLIVENAAHIKSSTHTIALTEDRENTCVTLAGGEVLPDRDFVLTWRCLQDALNPALHVLTHRDGEYEYFMALAAPPAAVPGVVVSREVILLIDRSGSMKGAKWEAADTAAIGILNGLGPSDVFNIGLFHNTTRWLFGSSKPASDANRRSARHFMGRHDSGGTEFGTALEQAIKLPRSPEVAARHIAVITDAQVSDDGRILRLVHEEAERQDRRRISMICIDSAPNAHLVNEIVEAGCGSARFLTSMPGAESLQSALAGIADEFSAPLAANLSLEVNRDGLEVFGRRPKATAFGVSVPLGDLAAGRATWISGRYAASAETEVVFRLRPGDGGESAQGRPSSSAHPMLKPLFGARRLNALEHLVTSGLTGAELHGRMREIGFGEAAVISVVAERALYAENAMEGCRTALKDLMVRESLEFGIACSETAFVAVRQEAGRLVDESVIVANALPAGWSENVLCQLSVRGLVLNSAAPAQRATSSAVMRSGSSREPAALLTCRRYRGACSYEADYDDGADSPPFLRRLVNRLFGRHSQDSAAFAAPTPTLVFVGVPELSTGEAALFDSANILGAGRLPDLTQELQSLSMTVYADGRPHSYGGLAIRFYLGDATEPALTIPLTELEARRWSVPVSLKRSIGERLRIVLFDANGIWAQEAPLLEIRVG